MFSKCTVVTMLVSKITLKYVLPITLQVRKRIHNTFMQ